MVRKVLTEDWDNYALGDVNVVNNVWGKDWRITQNYNQTVTIDDDADLSGGIVFDWDWGTVTDHVLAYPEVVVGYKPWDGPGIGTNALSTALSDIRDFDITHRLALTGDTVDFNVAYDLWLTSKAMGDEHTITTELMIWAHKGGPIDDNTFVGSYTQKGTTFDIIRYDNFGDPSGGTDTDWRYLALVPREDILDKTIDVNAIFHMLIKRGLISDENYLTGYELGAEIYGGDGSLTVDHLSHSFDTYDANGKANVLKGTGGGDRIHGLGGNDTISGLAGQDFLDGGRGADALSGGTGSDVFFFNHIDGKADRITDFEPGIDTIALAGTMFGALDGADTFKVGKAFGENTHLLYIKGKGELLYDADGAGGDDPHLIAVLENHVKLKYSDFEIV